MADIASSVNEVEGKVAIVTGAASGIGLAIAELLHARGAKVVAEDIDRDVERLARPGLVPLVADVKMAACPCRSADFARAVILGRDRET